MRYKTRWLWVGISVGLLLVGGLFAWKAVIERERQALRSALERSGAIVLADASGKVSQIILPRGRRPDLSRLGVFSGLDQLNLEGVILAEKDLVHLRDHDRLRILNLGNTGVGDASLAHVQSLSNLWMLDLSGTKVTAAAVRRLKRALPKLQQVRLDPLPVVGLRRMAEIGGLAKLDAEYNLSALDLSLSDAGDADLAALRGRTSLRMLNLGGRPVTDAGLEHVASLAGLEELWLSNTRVTSEGLRHLKGLKNLRALSLTNTAVGDDGLESLAQLPRLEILHLAGTKVTDAGIDHLRNLTRLDKLWLKGTDVSADGFSNIRDSLPETIIVGHADPVEPLPEVETRIVPG
ncbi:MAG: hypothetical protein KY476_17550 [Planctomycetes bacterium]|nr:hypothetical protein [Planctomycetota bacterium]